MNTPLHCAKTWQLRKLVKGQAREIQELRGAGLHISEPYTGHTWCLLSWEAQYTIIGINSIGDCKIAALATRADIVAHKDFYLCPLLATQASAEELERRLAPIWSGEQP